MFFSDPFPRLCLEPWVNDLEKIVEAEERHTSVEFAMVFTEKSGNYNEVRHQMGVVFSFALLVFLLFSPIDFHPLLIPLAIFLAHLVGVQFLKFLPAFWLWFIPRPEIENNCRVMAQSTFLSQNLHLTRDRTGMLIFISVFEKQLKVVVDAHIRHCLTPAELDIVTGLQFHLSPNTATWGEEIGNFLQRAAEVLRAKLPPVGDNPDEIPNRPIFL